MHPFVTPMGIGIRYARRKHAYDNDYLNFDNKTTYTDIFLKYGTFPNNTGRLATVRKFEDFFIMHFLCSKSIKI